MKRKQSDLTQRIKAKKQEVVKFDESDSDYSSDEQALTNNNAQTNLKRVSPSLPIIQSNKRIKTSFAWNNIPPIIANRTKETAYDEDSNEESDEEVIDDELVSHQKHHDVHHLTETEIAEIEESLPNKAPTSESDFERLVIGEPNNSFLWIQYMTFMLNTYGFEKAKEIGERAVNRIHFSKENERFNLWSAILSLYVSNNRGNVDSVIEKALQGASKPHLIYLQYSKILNKLYEKKKQRMDANEQEEDSQDENEEDEELKNKRANELEELLTKIDQVYRKACKKYRNEKKVFEEYQHWCISTLKDIKKAENVLNRSLKVYPQKEHISLKSKFAIILYKCENIIEARNVMENIIQNNPKRSDAWSIYLDCEQQHTNDHRYIRELFERVCNLTTLSTKKMKSFLQRYLKFETQNGDSERQEHVKQIAKEYIQSKLDKSKTDSNKD